MPREQQLADIKRIKGTNTNAIRKELNYEVKFPIMQKYNKFDTLALATDSSEGSPICWLIGTFARKEDGLGTSTASEEETEERG